MLLHRPISRFLENEHRVFWSLAAVYVLVWTLLPTLFRQVLPLDAMEGATWGHQLQWGYDKNPWLNAWLTELAIRLGGTSGVLVYFLSGLCVLLAFWSTWQLGRRILPHFYGLIAALSLVTMQYYSLAAVDFNDNVLELGLWPFSAYCFYFAIHTKKLKYWVLFGVASALAMMAKYYTAFFLICLLGYLLSTKDSRQAWKDKGLYVAGLIFSLICLPHVIWLFHHDFITLQYAAGRIDNRNTFLAEHLILPVSFALSQFSNLLLALALFSIVMVRNRTPVHNIIVRPKKYVKDARPFLWWVAIAPTVLTMFAAMIFGWRLHVMWGTPLLSFVPLLFLSYVQPTIEMVQFRRFLLGVWLVFALAAVSYTLLIVKPNSESSANFPGRDIAQQVCDAWHARYHTPLRYVAGERWLAGNVALYCPDRPAVYMEWNNQKSPWVNEANMRQSGAVFVQLVDAEHVDFAPDIHARYPALTPVQTLTFPWHRIPDDSVKVLVSFLPPQQ